MQANPSQSRRKNSIVVGLIIVAIGVLWLLSRMGYYIPDWVISWKTFLIAIGIGIGASSGFRNPASYVLIIVGGIFLIDDLNFLPGDVRTYIWPLALIAVGLIVLIRPPGKMNKSELVQQVEPPEDRGTLSHGDKLDSVSVFSGNKQSVHSKNFVGGETVTVFGSTELDLRTAEFSKPVLIDSSVVFGSLKLIVPPHWRVHTEASRVFAEIKDKRVAQEISSENEKLLVLTGAAVFGSIEIVSY